MNAKGLPWSNGTFRTAALVSALPVMPFMILETVNSPNLPCFLGVPNCD